MGCQLRRCTNCRLSRQPTAALLHHHIPTFREAKPASLEWDSQTGNARNKRRDCYTAPLDSRFPELGTAKQVLAR